MQFHQYAVMLLGQWSHRVKPSTLAMYEYQIHMLDRFGNFDISKLTTAEMQKIADDMSTEFSRATISNMLVFMRMVLRNAMRNGIIPERSFDQIRISAPKSRRLRNCLNDDEFAALSDYCVKNPKNRGSVACLLGLLAGLRIGEIAALRWDDINFRRNRIHICRTRQRIYRSGGRSELHDGSPKSETSDRVIPMASKLRTALEIVRSARPVDEYVASTLKRGTEPRQIRIHMAQTMESAGIEPINPHGLRHSFISMAIGAGGSIKAVSEMAGHADAKITLDIYTHATEKSKEAAITALETL